MRFDTRDFGKGDKSFWQRELRYVITMAYSWRDSIERTDQRKIRIINNARRSRNLARNEDRCAFPGFFCRGGIAYAATWSKTRSSETATTKIRVVEFHGEISIEEGSASLFPPLLSFVV